MGVHPATGTRQGAEELVACCLGWAGWTWVQAPRRRELPPREVQVMCPENDCFFLFFLFCSPASLRQQGLLVVQWEGQEKNHHSPHNYCGAGKTDWGTQQRRGPKAFGEPRVCPKSQLGHLALTCMVHSPHQSLGSPSQPFPEEISQAQEAHLGLFCFIASILLGFTGFRPKPNTPPAASRPGPAAQAGPCRLDTTLLPPRPPRLVPAPAQLLGVRRIRKAITRLPPTNTIKCLSLFSLTSAVKLQWEQGLVQQGRRGITCRKRGDRSPKYPGSHQVRVATGSKDHSIACL